MARDRDVPDQDQLAVVLVEGLVEHRVGVGVQPGEDLARTPGPPGRASRAARRGPGPPRPRTAARGPRPRRAAGPARARASVGQGDRRARARVDIRCGRRRPACSGPAPVVDRRRGPGRRRVGAVPGSGGAPVARAMCCGAGWAPAAFQPGRRPRLPGRRGRGPPVRRRTVVGQDRVRRLRARAAVGQARGLRGPRLVRTVAPAPGSRPGRPGSRAAPGSRRAGRAADRRSAPAE